MSLNRNHSHENAIIYAYTVIFVISDWRCLLFRLFSLLDFCLYWKFNRLLGNIYCLIATSITQRRVIIIFIIGIQLFKCTHVNKWGYLFNIRSEINHGWDNFDQKYLIIIIAISLKRNKSMVYIWYFERNIPKRNTSYRQ